MPVKLRPWQTEALVKAKIWLLDERRDRHFLVNAAPGSGKTILACAIAQILIEADEIDRVVVIAPRAEVVNQWADDFKFVTDRFMAKVTARDGDIGSLELDVCATWSAVQGLLPELQAVCRTDRVLVICDEHHHAAVEATWGTSAESAFADATFALVLTGTPIRSDGAETAWLAYDQTGAIDHPEDGTYTLTYGDAVDLGYCRPVTFHRHEGRFSIDLDDGSRVRVSGHAPAELPSELRRIPGLQRTLDFYKLACTPLFESDGFTPLRTGYQATMIDWGIDKLAELRLRMPNAGGLVIAPTIEMADYMAELIELIEGERPVVVHSNTPNVESKIKAFRNTDKRWLVSVAMISEGVDIKRLRVLLYLPSAHTELAFRQAIGRVVRTAGPDDDTRAYVVMPSFETFEVYARRVEEEMTPAQRADAGQPRQKRCPACGTECELGASICLGCDYEFPERTPRLKACADCGSLNTLSASACQVCGAVFAPDFTLTLTEALRTGAIVRGMELDELEVVAGENIASRVRNTILSSGDDKLVRIVRLLPEESWARLRTILSNDSDSTCVD